MFAVFQRFYGARRVPLSSKWGNKNYYKGKRTGSMGNLDQYGRFHLDPSKCRILMLRPYVSQTTPKIGSDVLIPMDPEAYMQEALKNDSRG